MTQDAPPKSPAEIMRAALAAKQAAAGKRLGNDYVSGKAGQRAAAAKAAALSKPPMRK